MAGHKLHGANAAVLVIARSFARIVRNWLARRETVDSSNKSAAYMNSHAIAGFVTMSSARSSRAPVSTLPNPMQSASPASSRLILLRPTNLTCASGTTGYALRPKNFHQPFRRHVLVGLSFQHARME